METRQLGNSGINVSVLTFGAWAIGDWESGVANPSHAIEAIRKAYEFGFSSFDTGPLYGFGFSEEILATALLGLPRDKIQIITKCGVVWEGSSGKLWYPNKIVNDQLTNIYKYSGKDSIIKECEDSLRRLKTDYIDLYSIHWPDCTTPIEESMEAFSILLSQGKIRAAGLSNEYSISEWNKADKIVSLASGKVRYNMLNRKIEGNLLPYCRENGKSIMAYSVLQRGILTGKDMPRFLWTVDDDPYEVALYEDDNMRLIRIFLDSIEPVALDYNVDLTHLGIRWVIDQLGVATALLAATNPEQIAYDAKSLDFRINEGDRNFIEVHLKALEERLAHLRTT
jgi:aryl-alcohol dehydrogenase-like predicted oxidoreductase